MMLEVLYEDNHLLVINKPIGILSQADVTGDVDIFNIAKSYLKEKYHKPGNVYVGLVHRLDRMTGGVMVLAKTSKAAARLSEQIRNHTFDKRYLAIVEGRLEGNGTMEDRLAKDTSEVKSYISPLGKQANLSYQVIDHFQNTSLVDIILMTGRHHQIRVQFASRGHILIGDLLYGSKQQSNLCLFAYRISLIHPVTKVLLTFTAYPSGKEWSNYRGTLETMQNKTIDLPK